MYYFKIKGSYINIINNTSNILKNLQQKPPRETHGFKFLPMAISLSSFLQFKDAPNWGCLLPSLRLQFAK